MALNNISSNTVSGTETQILSNTSNQVVANTNILRSILNQNAGVVRSNIPKSRSVNLTSNIGNTYGATVISNRTDRRGAIDNIKLKHQKMFGSGADSTRRNNPFIVT